MRRPFLITVAVLAAAGLAAAGLSLGAIGRSSSTRISAKLTPRAETPAPKGAHSAYGSFNGVLIGSRLTWRLTFAKLTGRATAAHIHLGRPGVAGPVVVPLCGPCVSGAHGTATLTAKVSRALLSRGAYVNVHTVRNAAGEIRGQLAGSSLITPQPAPTTTTDTTTSPGGYGY